MLIYNKGQVQHISHFLFSKCFLMKMTTANNPSSRRGSNSVCVLDTASGYRKMSPNEIQVQEVEVSTGGLSKLKINEKVLKWLLFLGVFLFLLIGGLYMGFKPSDESETPKQCLPGHYGFPDCISK